MRKKVIIFDDNKERLNAVAMLLGMTDDLQCSGTFTNAANAVQELNNIKPDLVLMDIDMPGGDGISGTMEIRKHYPDLPILMQTVFDDNDNIFESLKAGANGYLLKSTSPEKLLTAIREALDGGVPMTRSVSIKVLQFFQQKPTQIDYKLSSREKEILKLLTEGYSYKMIAAQLTISANTVSNHINKIYKRLQVNSATEAVSLALKNGLLK